MELNKNAGDRLHHPAVLLNPASFRYLNKFKFSCRTRAGPDCTVLSVSALHPENMCAKNVRAEYSTKMSTAHHILYTTFYTSAIRYLCRYLVDISVDIRVDI